MLDHSLDRAHSNIIPKIRPREREVDLPLIPPENLLHPSVCQALIIMLELTPGRQVIL